MNRQKTIIFIIFTLVILIGSYIGIASSNQPLDLTNIHQDLPTYPETSTSLQIFQQKIKQNPADAASYTVLGNLYLRAARETGEVSNYTRAEAAFLKALELVPHYTLAQTSLASAYYAQHQFLEALKLAQDIHTQNPENTQALTTIGDVQLALGEYETAEQSYRTLAESNDSAPVLVRLAQLAELKGDPEEALALIQQAAEKSILSGGSKEEIAWYLFRLGELSFNTGNVKQARDYYQASLRVFENYYLSLAGMGKVHAAEGDLNTAIEYYEKTIDIIPQPDFLAVLGDLYHLTGNENKARQQYDTVILIGQLAEINEQVYNRQLANFYADHDIHLEEALQLAKAELHYRTDIHGYDAAAWASYKNGQYAQAETWINQALQWGTRDARLYYHAGMIALALGNLQEAYHFLDQALSINPHFDPLQAPLAQQTFDQLQ